MKNGMKNEKQYLAKRCTVFSLQVITFLDKLPRSLAVDIIAKQLLRAATSIGANVVEAQGASSKRDFVKYFQIALKSALETRYWLYLILKSNKADSGVTQRLSDELEELRKMLSASLMTMKGNR